MDNNVYYKEEQFIIKNKTRPPLLYKEIFEWSEAVVFSLIFVVLLFTFVFRIVGVEGPSMEDTLHNKDRIIISHLFYKPQQGDIVVITKPTIVKKPIIKRIIATENQVVDINFETREVFVDGQLLQEDYIKEPTAHSGDVKFPVTVPEGCVFVMGDNRNNSFDSRSSEIGMVDTRYILGKAVFRIYPYSKFGRIE